MPDIGPTVVVGVDGSLGALAALRFAADGAHRRRSPLRVVAVERVHVKAKSGSGPSAISDLAELMVAPAVGWAEEVGPPVRVSVDEYTAWTVREETARFATMPVELQAWRGDPGPVLAAQSAGTAMLVVGTRGRGGFPGLRLGSVAEQVLHRAAAPVVTVPPGYGTGPGPSRWVVLGLTGTERASDGTLAAVRFATDEARVRGAVLEVVVVPPGGIGGRGPRPRSMADDQRLYDSVMTLVESAGGRPDDVELQVELREGSAAGEWIAAAREADLLVIEGGRGHPAATSRCRQVVYHSDRPVAVVGCSGSAGPDHADGA